MSAVALFFAACTLTTCREVQLPWDGSQQACMLYGQQQVAAWLAERRGLTAPRGWRCEVAQRT